MSWRAKEGGLMKPEGAFSTPAGPELIFHVVFIFLFVFSQRKQHFFPPVTQLNIIGKEKLSSDV